MIEPEKQPPSISRQCQLLGLSRSSFYYKPQPIKVEDLKLMRKIDELYLQHPCWGSRSMVRQLERQGIIANRKHIQRLMRLMGIEAVYPKPRTSRPHPEHKIYPYLLRNLTIDRPNQVWATDITWGDENFPRRYSIIQPFMFQNHTVYPGVGCRVSVPDTPILTPDTRHLKPIKYGTKIGPIYKSIWA